MHDTMAPPERSVPPGHFIQQDWTTYTPLQHRTWSALYARRMPLLRSTASRVFLDGAAAIGLGADHLPDLALLNRRLLPRTGWSAVPVDGFLPAEDFFGCLAQRKFPTTVTIRPFDRLDYVPEPDIFHDVFGHVPLHADPVFADFLQRFGALAAAAKTPEQVDRMARLFWFTVEFGLVREGGDVKVYGSGLISSHADSAKALSMDADRRPFELGQVLDQPFRIDDLQPILYVVDGFQQLFAAISSLEGGRA